jgi:hypothetical protein
MPKLERANLYDPFTEAGPGRPTASGLYHDYMARWREPDPVVVRVARATLDVVVSVLTWKREPDLVCPKFSPRLNRDGS